VEFDAVGGVFEEGEERFAEGGGAGWSRGLVEGELGAEVVTDGFDDLGLDFFVGVTE